MPTSAFSYSKERNGIDGSVITLTIQRRPGVRQQSRVQDAEPLREKTLAEDESGFISRSFKKMKSRKKRLQILSENKKYFIVTNLSTVLDISLFLLCSFNVLYYLAYSNCTNGKYSK